jgi:homoserine dehydrogenase
VGLGTVASGTVNVLQRNAQVIAGRTGRPVEITHIGARRDNPACDTSAIKVSRDIFEVVKDPNVDVVVELIGGYEPAKQLVLEAIANGKHVVTANKALIAVHGNEIFEAAAEKGVVVAYEAAVAGGIPIIKALREGLAGNDVDSVAGIINGTGNFILTEMRDKGRDFADVLAEAQALGYAEADPTFDVEGIDAAHKLVILGSIAFGVPLEFEKVFTEGISKIEPEDVNYAEELGYRIKHLGIARKTDLGIELRVHPTMIPEGRLIANVKGVKNAVLVQSDAVGPSLYYGAGAGSEPTASAVVADIVDIARMPAGKEAAQVPYLSTQQSDLVEANILPIESCETAFYLRLSADDKPGVLAAITQFLAQAEISIEAVLQHEPTEGQDKASLIMLTNRVAEGRFRQAVEQIEALDGVHGNVITMRVEALDG